MGPRRLATAAWFLVPIAILYVMDRGKQTAGTPQLWPWLYATTVSGCVHLLFAVKARSLVAPRWLVFPTAVLALRLISYGPSTNVGAYLHAVAQSAVYVLVPLIVFNVRALRFSDVRRVAIAPIVLVLGGSLIGIFRHENPFSYGDVLGSALGHRNVASVFLAACLPLLLTWGRAPGSILATLSIYVILANRTRSAWLMLMVYAVGIAAVFLLSRTTRIARLARRSAIGFAVALACLVVVPTGLRWSTASPYVKSLTTMASPKESSGRDQIWLVSLAMLKKHPLRGVGSGGYPVHFDGYLAESQADRKVLGTVVGMNDYLQEAAESGALGGAAMVLTILGGALALHRAFRRRKWTLAILGLGPLALGADALVDYPMGRVETALLFFVPVGLLLRDLRAPSVSVARTLVALSSVAATALFTFITSRLVLSQVALSTYRATKDFEAYERHYRAWPWRREIDDLLVVRTYLSEKRNEEAALFARQRVHDWPHAATTQLALALVHESTDDFESAARVYRGIFAGTGQCHPEVAAAYRRMASVAPEWAVPAEELPRCLASAADARSVAPATAWKQTQTFLSEWRGEPVFAASFGDRYRPYVFHAGEAMPVLPSSIELGDIDFFSPTPLSDDELILSGSPSGREDRFDLYLFDRSGKLTNLTRSAEANHGNACLLPSARLIAWREKQSQMERFAVVTADGKLEPRGTSASPFDACLWIDARTMVAYARSKSGWTLSRCTLARDVRCEPLPALAEADDVLQLFRAPDGSPAVIARLRGSAFRRPFRISPNGAELLPLPVDPGIEGDVLGVDGAHTRIGLHGRYTLDATPRAEDGVVHAWKQIGHDVYTIQSDASAAKFLALKTEHGYARVAPKPETTSAAREPLEVWLVTPAGRRVQAFYFGPLDPTRVVVWWHGGPKENVSPRFNPYFAFFDEIGFGVLAVNYPGSTGRGASFEELFTAPGALLDTVDAVLGYLRENDVRTIVSWSVSTGEVFQSLVLDGQHRVSAVVDEGGAGVRRLRARAEEQRVPFFSIMGRFDPSFDASAKNDFVYEGGHALLHLEDFLGLRHAAAPFLERAPAIPEPARATAKDSLLLDPGHEGNASDPNTAGALREASLTFELSHAIVEECALVPPPTLLRTGSATLLSRGDALAQRAALIRARETPAVSIHFNASDPSHRSANLASVFLPDPPHPREVATATRLLGGLAGSGLGPKESYPELAQVTRRVAPGIFVRGGLAVLGGTSEACRFLVEVAYYDDPIENERLSKRTLASDGTYVRPRLHELARALCDGMLEVARCKKSAGE